jgi:hypothetical protein
MTMAPTHELTFNGSAKRAGEKVLRAECQTRDFTPLNGYPLICGISSGAKPCKPIDHHYTYSWQRLSASAVGITSVIPARGSSTTIVVLGLSFLP